jgi:protein-glutamine gamma-glutamyltransferase
MRRLPLRRADQFWIIAALGAAITPHFAHLPLWVSAFVVAVFVWRAYLTVSGRRLPSRWLLSAVAAAASIGVLATHDTLFGREAGLTLLVLMVSLKLVELKNYRDAMFAVFLGFFLLLALFLYTQTLFSAAYACLVVWLSVAAIVGLNRPSARLSTRQRLYPATLLLAQAIPLMLLFFLLFPRVHGPLWGMPGDAHAGLAGLSDSMAPGSVGKLRLSQAVAFRVTFSDPLPSPGQLYWRGPVLWDFDDGAWRSGKPVLDPPGVLQSSSRPVHHAVTLEPHGERWLFALDLPGGAPPESRINADYQILSLSPVVERRRYNVVSYPEFRTPRVEKEASLKRALALPAQGNVRARELARKWRETGVGDAALIQVALRYFNQEPFYYTLSPPRLEGDTVDAFLFRSRSGFCEHYAGSFVFLMRAAGVPARVVTGYQGGEFNPLGDYLIVRQSDAHAWAEVWLAGRGWSRVDPTAAVAPQRVIDTPGLATASEGIFPGLVGLRNAGWLSTMRFGWDAFNNSWNQWVLGYDHRRQMNLMKRIGITDPSWRDLTVAMTIALFVALCVLAVVLLARSPRRSNDPVVSAYRKMCRKLARRGLVRSASEGPLDFARRAALGKPAQAGKIMELTDLYLALRYSRKKETDNVRQLRRGVRKFNPG